MDYILHSPSSNTDTSILSSQTFPTAIPPVRAPTDIASRGYRSPCSSEKYIHRGSRRSFNFDDTKPIRSFWSPNPHPARRSTGRSIDHSSLANLAMCASAGAGVKPDRNDLAVGLFNIRSLNNKGLLLHDLLEDRKFDFICLTETWQQPNDFSQLNQTIPPGFVYTSKSRLSGRGGDLAILYNEKWKVSALTVPVSTSFESIALQINGPIPTILATVYRPPKANKDFLNELSAFFYFPIFSLP